jgi:hypothetical protein
MEGFKKTPRVQGQDSIVIDKPTSDLWPLIQDSMQMESWGPPVEKVELELLPDQDEENVGSKRKVYAKFTEKRKGWYQEVRTEQEEGKSIAFKIYEDSFGIGKMLDDVGGKMELEKVSSGKIRFIFTFYHRPKSLLGWIMNPMIKMDQKKNRLKALKSIKSYAETGKAIKN